MYAAFFLQRQGVTRLDVLNYVSHGVSKTGVDDEDDAAFAPTAPGDVDGEPGAPQRDPLETFCVSLSARAAEGKIDPLIGRKQVASEFGVYVQDTFKVNSRLSLDLGLRWDRFGAATYDDGLIFNWDRQTGNVVVPQEALNSISPLYPTNTINVVAGETKQRPSLRNFAPRFGFAYRPFGATFVIRGGYGIYTETIGRYARAQGVGPYQLSETFFNSIENGQPLFAFPNPFPAGSGRIASQSVIGYALDTRNGRIHQFNFTLAKQAGCACRTWARDRGI